MVDLIQLFNKLIFIRWNTSAYIKELYYISFLYVYWGHGIEPASFDQDLSELWSLNVHQTKTVSIAEHRLTAQLSLQRIKEDHLISGVFVYQKNLKINEKPAIRAVLWSR